MDASTKKPALRGPFERVVCVNLDRRDDKWADFQGRIPDPWPFGEIERYSAIDCKRCKPPKWWNQGGPAWGCYRSHLNILEDCMNRGIKSCLFFEDDALFCENFSEKFAEYWEAMPKDWDMAYLGGQFLGAEGNPPLRINDWCYQPFNVNRTHAYAVSAKFMPILYKHLNAADIWKRGHHIDHHYGRIHQQRKYQVVVPRQWLVGQIEGHSDIKCQTMPTRYWIDAQHYGQRCEDFAIVLGLHGSGSSCLAMCLKYLGVHMGNQMAYRKDSGEAKDLARHCEAAMPFPQMRLQETRDKFGRKVVKWMRARMGEAAKQNTIAGAKYPHLCTLLPPMADFLGEHMKLIHIDRPLKDSITSLQKREPKQDAGQIARLQTFLHEEKQKQLDQHEHLTVQYYDLLYDPAKELQRVIQFLGIEVTGHQLSKAVLHVQPEKQHVGEVPEGEQREERAVEDEAIAPAYVADAEGGVGEVGSPVMEAARTR